MNEPIEECLLTDAIQADEGSIELNRRRSRRSRSSRRHRSRTSHSRSGGGDQSQQAEAWPQQYDPSYNQGYGQQSKEAGGTFPVINTGLHWYNFSQVSENSYKHRTAANSFTKHPMFHLIVGVAFASLISYEEWTEGDVNPNSKFLYRHAMKICSSVVLTGQLVSFLAEYANETVQAQSEREAERKATERKAQATV